MAPESPIPPAFRGEVPTVTPAQALAAPQRCVIDLRSPVEFSADHVPGSRNVPLFDDVERAVIGTLYQQRSPSAAFAEGAERTVERIGSLTREIAGAVAWDVPPADLESVVERMCAGGVEALDRDLSPVPLDVLPDQAVVLLCWRGGLRSRSVTAFLRGLGLDRAVCLEGGYRAYRRWVRERIERWEAPPTFVLRGLTGVGKTLVLRELEEIRPRWTLDLEGLAGHRSSILGMVGLEPCTQKTFDSRLAARLDEGFVGPCVVEGESRKVGDVILPPVVWNALGGGTSIELVAPPERRIEVLREDYLARERNRDQIAAQLPFIENRLGKRRWAGRLVELLHGGREDELVALLLEHYYDPLYRHSEKGRDYAVTIDTSDPRAAAERVAEWIEGRGAHATA